MSMFRKLGREIDKGWRRLRAPKGMRELPPEFPYDFSPFTKRLCRKVAPYTMTSRERIYAIENAVRYVDAHGIPGDIVECGVAGGGSVMAFAYCLQEVGDTGRILWAYDTFEGMPEPTGKDVGRFGDSGIKGYKKRLKNGVSTWINISLERVREAIHATGYPAHKLRFVKGKVEDTLPETKPERIAILRLDTDWYASTKAELEHLFPRLETGGILLLDDYYRWGGHREAVDDYLAANGIRMFLARIDDHAVIGVKA